MKKETPKKPNVLFDTLSALFNNKDYINNLTKESMKQNLFMINRRLAIKYPLQAQIFNNKYVNACDVIKFWSDYLYNGKFAPRWIYTPGASKSQAAKDSKNPISLSLKKAFCKHYDISIKDVDAALKFFTKEITAEIKDFETLNKQLKNEETDQL